MWDEFAHGLCWSLRRLTTTIPLPISKFCNLSHLSRQLFPITCLPPTGKRSWKTILNELFQNILQQAFANVGFSSSRSRYSVGGQREVSSYNSFNIPLQILKDETVIRNVGLQKRRRSPDERGIDAA